VLFPWAASVTWRTVLVSFKENACQKQWCWGLQFTASPHSLKRQEVFLKRSFMPHLQALPALYLVAYTEHRMWRNMVKGCRPHFLSRSGVEWPYIIHNCGKWVWCHFRSTWNKLAKWGLVLVAHSYNPSYSGDRDQEGGVLKPAWANSSRDPISKTKQKTLYKKGLVEWLNV
jgi:hypothetical protein